MKQWLALILTIFVLTSCSDPGKSTTSQDAKPERNKAAQSVAAASATLDIIVAGPFALIEKAGCNDGSNSCLALWAPNAHPQMTGLSAPAQLKQIDAGDYNFETGVRGSTNTKIESPVSDASVYQIPATMQKATTKPLAKPYATIVLPMPREIIPWNADPMQIVANGSPVPPSGATSNLATLVVLRYDFQTGDVPVMTNSDGPFWKAAPITSGSEKYIIIGFTNGNPTATTLNAHIHAISAFDALVKMLGLKWKLQIADPPSSFKRNRPFEPDPPTIPQDLLNIIDQIPLETQGQSLTQTSPVYSFFGKINDCKAPAILVTK